MKEFDEKIVAVVGGTKEERYLKRWISQLISASAAVQPTPRQASPISPETKKYFSDTCWGRTSSAMSGYARYVRREWMVSCSSAGRCRRISRC